MNQAITLMGILVGASGFGYMGFAAEMPADLDEYDWRCNINGTFESGQTYKVPLTPDVYSGFRSFPLDLRVVDRDGETWPSIVWARPDRRGVEVVHAMSREGTAVTENSRYQVKEFLVEPDNSGKFPVHNQVIINAGTGDFVRRVEVWGGANINNLELLGAGLIIEQKSASLRSRSIDYPDSSTPLVVVRIIRDAEHPDDEMEWRSTEIVRVLRDDSDHEKIEMKKMRAPDDEPEKDGVHCVYLDTGAQNRPLLYLDVEMGRDIISPVRVFGRVQETNKWRWVADGGIHVMDDAVKSRIVLANANYRYLKLEFFAYGEKEPKVEDVVAGAIPHYLIFDARSDKKPYLYFGSPRYQLPMSDLSRRINAEVLADAHEATLSRCQTNPTRVASSLSAYGRTLLRLGIGIVVLLVAIVTIRVIKHRYW